ncbi:zinc finger protein 697 isoform X2 [Lingula anatina]|nr:zinc finger protein 697 isoform X2 [Lingula anatina]XP_013390919.1 zinc finger protein 697 isoform X2 [Lingula anatina]XP_013390920.1 zinc finger protein 697 isoform X2 [Lingula anatina]|eukprot:XP_013390918.1 zinc finger protein 697 isoform X2 [Lingula anatina]
MSFRSMLVSQSPVSEEFGHPKSPVYVCRDCDFSAANPSDVLSHISGVQAHQANSSNDCIYFGHGIAINKECPVKSESPVTEEPDYECSNATNELKEAEGAVTSVSCQVTAVSCQTDLSLGLADFSFLTEAESSMVLAQLQCLQTSWKSLQSTWVKHMGMVNTNNQEEKNNSNMSPSSGSEDQPEFRSRSEGHSDANVKVKVEDGEKRGVLDNIIMQKLSRGTDSSSDSPASPALSDQPKSSRSRKGIPCKIRRVAEDEDVEQGGGEAREMEEVPSGHEGAGEGEDDMTQSHHGANSKTDTAIDNEENKTEVPNTQDPSKSNYFAAAAMPQFPGLPAQGHGGRLPNTDVEVSTAWPVAPWLSGLTHGRQQSFGWNMPNFPAGVPQFAMGFPTSPPLASKREESPSLWNAPRVRRDLPTASDSSSMRVKIGDQQGSSGSGQSPGQPGQAQVQKGNQDPKAVPTKKEPLKCRFCNFTCNNRYSLKRHERRHGNEDDKFTCQYCRKSFNERTRLTEHINFKHENKQKVCEVCGKSFSSMSGYRAHQKIKHTDKGTKKCELCQLSFLDNWHYEGHMNKHYKLKPYQCEECHKTFSHRISYQRHRRSCASERKSHTCTICHKEFAHKFNLDEHYAGKHDRRQICCKDCGRIFSWKTSYLRHVRTMHPSSVP